MIGFTTSWRAALLGQRWAITKGFALLIGLLLLSAQAGAGIERFLRNARDDMRSHSASGEIVIVEIDARSLASINSWPWPRRHHANAIDRLWSAEARLIAYDVTFSAPSNPGDDAALAAALERAQGTVILPTLIEQAGSGSSDVVESLPYEAFANRAFLAGVNIIPDEDGYIRQIPLGTLTAGIPRPSLASMVAEAPGDIDAMLDIDFAIDPATIPRVSFVDLAQGRVPTDAVRGRRILIGATAVDLGDRYAVPVHGVIPGVVIQALAAETLLTGRMPRTVSGIWAVIFATLFTVLTVRPGRRMPRVAIFCAGSVALIASPLVTEHWFAVTFPVVPALAVLCVATVGMLAGRLAERFRRRTYTDAATGLPNGVAMVEALAEQKGAYVVVARIDRFVAIAVGIGPTATIALMHQVANRLRITCDRVIYRIDEHSLGWIESRPNSEAIEEHFAALAKAMRPPVDCGRLVDVKLSFGVAAGASGLGQQAEPRQQLANAALASERAARMGLPWAAFADEREDETDWHLSLLGELDAAMAAGEVWNAYQPKLDIASGRIIGVETLVRWHHRERGPVGPDQFIPMVEAHGRIDDLTLHVLRNAINDAASWQARGLDLSLAINVSATLLDDASFVAAVEKIIGVGGVPARRVTIEVTESATLKDEEAAARALAGWRRRGFGVSIDDYGTGQSSLGYLQKLPASELKIDKSFIRNIADDTRSAIMVRSTIALAHQLGMKVVAEGVETQEALALLHEVGCDQAQGWLIGKPMSRSELETMLAVPVVAAL